MSTLTKLFKKKKKDPYSAPKTPLQTRMNEQGIRQMIGCIPIDPINQRFLLISYQPPIWMIPNCGGWGKDESQQEAMIRETWIKAGVKGKITRLVGVFEENGSVHHSIYEMEISQVAKKFPEEKSRERRWFDYNEAMMVVKEPHVLDAISMSSLSPLVHPEEVEEESEKKKKKKEKKKKEKDEIELDEMEESDIDLKKKKERNILDEDKLLKKKTEKDDLEVFDIEKVLKKKKQKDTKNKKVQNNINKLMTETRVFNTTDNHSFPPINNQQKSDNLGRSIDFNSISKENVLLHNEENHLIEKNNKACFRQ